MQKSQNTRNAHIATELSEVISLLSANENISLALAYVAPSVAKANKIPFRKR